MHSQEILYVTLAMWDCMLEMDKLSMPAHQKLELLFLVQPIEIF